MVKIQEKLLEQARKMPDKPGVYFFLDKKKNILYIGKATSLRNRVRSYFVENIGEKRSPLIEKMVRQTISIKFEKTDSVLEALLLESRLIKKHSPPYNTADKDQKSFNYVVITDEKFPRVLLMREKELKEFYEPFSRENLREEQWQRREEIFSKKFTWFSRNVAKENLHIKETFGPFPYGKELKEALKIIRKIFPFRDKCKLPHPQTLSPWLKEGALKPKPCFNYQIGLCPGTCIGAITEKEYAKTVGHIKTFFRGNKKKLVKDFEKEMKKLAKKREFEKAAEIKKKIFALRHIQDIALIQDMRYEIRDTKFRIEAYDVAHISGTNMVGVMTVIENMETNKKEYRMFKIRTLKIPDDTKALREILERRLAHKEWRMPDLIVVDGGAAQINTSLSVLKKLKIKIPVVAVTKDERHKAKEIRSTRYEIRNMIKKYEKEILLANSEAHRFAIKFHRKLRDSLV